MRFEYLAALDPDNLTTGIYEGLPLSNAVIKRSRDNNLDGFNIFLDISLEHHPQHLGFLFQKDHNGKTAYERAIQKHGIDATFKMIQHPTHETLQILHHVMRDAPQHINDFSIRYPSAWYHHDTHGRSIVQDQLAQGNMHFKKDGMFSCQNDR